MSKKAKTWLAALVVGVAVVVIIVWFTVDRDSAAHQTSEPGQKGVSRTESNVDSASGDKSSGEEGTPAQAARSPRGTEDFSKEKDTPEWSPQPEVGFTDADLADAGYGVDLELGNFIVTPGEEFTVTVRGTGPALMIMALALTYDPNVVEAVQGSARPVGTGFRRGLEFSADNTKGELVLLQKGSPGKKNVNRCQDDVLAVFKMRAKTPGTTSLSLNKNASTFVNGGGWNEQASSAGGTIVVSP